MSSRHIWQGRLLCLAQLVLLGYFYTDPAGRVLTGWLYLGLLTPNSVALTWLAYQAFQAQRLAAGVVAAVLAFPGLFAGAVALVFLFSKH